MLPADVVSVIQDFVWTLFYVYLILVIAYILMSWVPLPYGVWINRVQRFLYDVVEPYLRLFRRVIPPVSFGGLGLDLSPILAILVLYAAAAIVQQGLELLR